MRIKGLQNGPTAQVLLNSMAVGVISMIILLVAVLLYSYGFVSATAHDCKNAMISDEWRDMVLNVHNEYRRTLAKGNQVGQNGALPVAQNMNKLYWDCNVEELALAEAEKCPTAPPAVNNYGVSFEAIAAKGTCNITAKVETQMKTWWRDGAKKQVTQATVAGNTFFSQMANAPTDIVACSYHFCSGSLALVCLYNKDGTAAADLYVSGASATDICNNCPNDCINALCDVAPAAVAPTDQLCQTNMISKALMTDDLRNQALYTHNYYRRLLASGWAKDASLTYAKPSTAMPALKYDCALEETIMTTLKDCGGTAAATNKAQNFIAYNDYKSERAHVLQKVIDDWWAPLESTGNADNKYTMAVESTLKTYINMAHHSGTAVGCGVQTCARIGQTLVQCAYEGVPTAADDNEIYPAGKPCSKCGTLNATPKCSPLGGLCVA